MIILCLATDVILTHSGCIHLLSVWGTNWLFGKVVYLFISLHLMGVLWILIFEMENFVQNGWDANLVWFGWFKIDVRSTETNLDLSVGCHFEMFPTNINKKWTNSVPQQVQLRQIWHYRTKEKPLICRSLSAELLPLSNMAGSPIRP